MVLDIIDYYDILFDIMMLSITYLVYSVAVRLRDSLIVNNNKALETNKQLVDSVLSMDKEDKEIIINLKDEIIALREETRTLREETRTLKDEIQLLTINNQAMAVKIDIITNGKKKLDKEKVDL